VLYKILKPIAVALMRWRLGLQVRGAERVPGSGPVLVVSNHQSVLDPPIIGGSTSRTLHFMAKVELFRIPGFGWLIRMLNAHPVRREGSDPKALKTAARLLEEGEALLAFPEGTRSRDGSFGEGKPGIGMLAVLTEVPVVPTYVTGTLHALPRGAWWPRRSKVRVIFGPALHFKPEPGAGRKERYREAAQEMMRAIAQLREQDEKTHAVSSAQSQHDVRGGR
jgi:1-acyl-sn-glycerol-3-phosphate acyltransferase